MMTPPNSAAFLHRDCLFRPHRTTRGREWSRRALLTLHPLRTEQEEQTALFFVAVQL
jgi:hypothetical protein